MRGNIIIVDMEQQTQSIQNIIKEIDAENVTAPKKMYVLCERRLDSIYSSVQGGHALAQWMIEHEAKWENETLIYLSCHLTNKIKEMEEHGYDFTVWREPDFNNTVTAVACYGDPDMLFVRLKTLR